MLKVRQTRVKVGEQREEMIFCKDVRKWVRFHALPLYRPPCYSLTV